MSKPLIVAVGASAGGLEALRDMFRSAPSHTGMSFVVVQHLSPDFKSMMVELLSRQTALTVETARDGVIPQAETVYVIEPGTLIRLEGDALRIEHTVQRDRVHLPIDHFFESVAIAREGHCVGVVLSGTGSDGSKGLEAIKEHGGTAVVQEPKSAAFDGMPRAALRTGVADLVLAPELIIQELIDLEQSGAAHVAALYTQKVDLGDGDALTEFWVAARAKLKSTGKGHVTLRIVVEED